MIVCAEVQITGLFIHFTKSGTDMVLQPVRCAHAGCAWLGRRLQINENTASWEIIENNLQEEKLENTRHPLLVVWAVKEMGNTYSGETTVYSVIVIITPSLFSYKPFYRCQFLQLSK